MIASLTRSIIALQLLLLTGLALLLVRLGLHWTAAAGISILLLVLGRASLIVSNYLVSGALRQPLADGRAAPLTRLIPRIAQEFACSMRCWFLLFPLGRPFRSVSAADNYPPVLLLHGYGSNSGFWKPMAKTLSVAGISHAAIDLEPVMGSIDDYAVSIEQAAQALCAASGQPQLIVLCHSMGGLAARAWLRAVGSERVAGVITLGTPHSGSTLARYGMGLNARQMEPDWEGGWLQALAAAEDNARRSLFVSIYSRHDNIVAPQSSALLPGATHVGLDFIGHVALGFDARVHDCVLAQISAIRRSKSTAGSR